MQGLLHNRFTVSSASPKPTRHVSAAVPFRLNCLVQKGRRSARKGGEFGTVTGRPRRCGWFDAVVARTAARLNGVNSFALTKIDVLSGFSTLRVCTAYEYKGQRYDEVPASANVLEQLTPIYEDLPGWSEQLTDIRSLDALPPTPVAMSSGSNNL